MKKLVFTALAVVAFSGVTFAGTKEVKEEVLLIKELEKKPEDFNVCEQMAIDSYEYTLEYYEVTNAGALLNYLIGTCHPENR